MRNAPAKMRAEPNVTPMIDVMLVLLIIFMTVGPLLADGFPAQPPRGRHLATHPDAEVDAVIGIDVGGQYFFNKKPVSEANLKALLADRFRGAADDHVVYLRADKGLPYGQVQVAMDLAATAGARVVGLVAEKAPELAHRSPR